MSRLRASDLGPLTWTPLLFGLETERRNTGEGRHSHSPPLTGHHRRCRWLVGKVHRVGSRRDVRISDPRGPEHVPRVT
jgi:hypothetical protein